MRILHPTDFSQTAQSALVVARDLRERLDGELHLVHVQQRFEEGRGFIRPQLDSLNPELTRRIEEERAAEVERLRGMLSHLSSPDATHELMWGNPHGANRIDQFFLGGVAGRFVRRSTIPVITVREESTTTKVRRILVATDFGEASKGAYAFAKKLTGAGIELVLAHVVDDVRVKDDPSYIHNVTDALEALSGGTAKRFVVREGNPARVLPPLAQEVGADLIAIGLRHHQAAAGLLLGSRADALIRSCPVPVLNVPLVVED